MRNLATRLALLTVLLGTAALTAGASAAAAAPAAFTRMAGHYEAIRAALAADSTAGVKAEAETVAKEAATLAGGSAAGVAPADAASCEQVMGRIAAAARQLAGAGDLAAARTAFGALSEPMVAYRNMVPGERPMVVHCPMAKKDWLQPAGPVANPYYGKKMLRCGEIVSR